MVKEPHMLHRAQAVLQEEFMLWLLQDVSKQRKELCVYLCVYSCGPDGCGCLRLLQNLPQSGAGEAGRGLLIYRLSWHAVSQFVCEP